VLDADVDAAADDGGLTLRLTVTNSGDDPVELGFASSQRVEFVARPTDAPPADDGDLVDGADDAVAWRASAGRMYAQALGTETVPAGGSVSLEERWPDPPAGEYRVVGAVVARGERDLRAATTVTA